MHGIDPPNVQQCAAPFGWWCNAWVYNTIYIALHSNGASADHATWQACAASMTKERAAHAKDVCIEPAAGVVPARTLPPSLGGPASAAQVLAQAQAGGAATGEPVSKRARTASAAASPQGGNRFQQFAGPVDYSIKRPSAGTGRTS